MVDGIGEGVMDDNAIDENIIRLIYIAKF